MDKEDTTQLKPPSSLVDKPVAANRESPASGTATGTEMTGPGRLVEGLLVHGAGLVVALLILGILIALTACDGEQSAPPARTSAPLEPTPAAVPTQTQAQSPIETLEPAPTPIPAVGSTQPATTERLPTSTPAPTPIPTALPIPTVTADSAISSATEAQAQVVSASP